MTSLWKLSEILAATGGKLHGSEEEEIFCSAVSINSRSIKQGELFIAIKGDNLDGHDYVSAAFEAGASCALVGEVRDEYADKNLVLVEDSFAAMYDMARYHRARLKAKFIAVTGSVGKTSAKEMLLALCLEVGKTFATPGNFNNHYGVPLSLCNMPLDCEYGIFEMGMNHSREIAPLSKLVRPHVSLITAIAPVHIEHLGSMEAICEAKMEIVEGMGGGILILPSDSEYINILQNINKNISIKTITFGKAERSDFRLVSAKEFNDINNSGQSIEMEFDGNELFYELGISAEHQAVNSVGALAACNEAGVDIRKASKALKSLSYTDGRGQIYKLKLPSGGVFYLMDDSYNASPISMQVGLKQLGLLAKKHQGRAIACLGDMLELGKDSPKYHADLVNDIIVNKIENIFLSGNKILSLYNKLLKELNVIYKDSYEELLEPLTQQIQPNDVVLVKGSHGSNMWRLVELLREHF